MENKVGIEKAIEVLNEYVNLDHESILNLFNARFECNKELANHPTIQVLGKEDGTFDVGIMGLINGLFGTDSEGWGHIAMDCETDKLDNREFKITKINGFSLLDRKAGM